MSSALALTEQTLDDVIVGALRQSRRRARTADCPVCGGTMQQHHGRLSRRPARTARSGVRRLRGRPAWTSGRPRGPAPARELIRRATRPLLREYAGALDATRLHRRRRCAGRRGGLRAPRAVRSGRDVRAGPRLGAVGARLDPAARACRQAPPRRSRSSRSSGAPASMSRSARPSAPTMICCCRWPPEPGPPRRHPGRRGHAGVPGVGVEGRAGGRRAGRRPVDAGGAVLRPAGRPEPGAQRPARLRVPGRRHPPLALLVHLSWRVLALPKRVPSRVTIPDEKEVVIGAALLATGHDWNSDDDGDLEDVVDLLAPLRGVIRVSRRPPAIGPGRAVAAMVRSLEAVETGRKSRFYLPSESYTPCSSAARQCRSTRRTRSARTPGWPMSSTRRSPPGSPRPPGGRRRSRRLARWSSGRCSATRASTATRVERGDGGARRVRGVGGEEPGDLVGSGPVIAPLLWLLLSSLGLPSRPHRRAHVGGAGSRGGHPSVRADGGRHRHRGHRRAAAQGPQGGGDRGHRALPGGAPRHALADQLQPRTEGGPLNLSVRFRGRRPRVSAPGGVVFVKPKNPTP